MDDYNYKKINQIELDLNAITYKNIEIGSLLAPSLDKLISKRYYNTNTNRIFFKVLLISKALFYSLKGRPPHCFKSSILYYKSGNANHHNRLNESVQNINYKVINVSGNKNLNDCYHDYRLTSFSQKFVILLWIVKNYSKIKKKLIEINTFSTSFFIDLIFQMFKAIYWKELLKRCNVELVIGDYDRGDDSAPFFAASNAIKIKSTVLQHGVINVGSGGYYPLIADEVLVWGNIAKSQLIELGVVENRIKVSGTPIIEKIEIKRTKSTQYKLKQKLGFEINKKLVVLAINPINNKDLGKHINGFLEAFKGVDNCVPLLKLHPSQEKDEILKICPFISTEQFLESVVSNNNLFLICDLLVTHNSGIANEALLNGVNVVIFDNLEMSSGNGIMLNSYFNIPLIKTTYELHKFITDSKSVKKSADMTNLYYKVGLEANIKIVNSLFLE